jgi:hypothetical protein
MSVVLFILVVWLMLILVGIVSPGLFVPFAKWKMRQLGRMFGFEITPKQDALIAARTRIACGFAFAAGLILLWWLLR